MPKVFISHSTADRAFVEDVLVPTLHDCGVETWYSKVDISAADHWERSILAGLESCDWFLIVMSPNSAKSEWVLDELHWAMGHRPHGRIIPILIKGCDPYEFHIRLPRLQFVDYSQDRATALSRLKAIWAEHAVPPSKSSIVLKPEPRHPRLKAVEPTVPIVEPLVEVPQGSTTRTTAFILLVMLIAALLDQAGILNWDWGGNSTERLQSALVIGKFIAILSAIFLGYWTDRFGVRNVLAALILGESLVTAVLTTMNGFLMVDWVFVSFSVSILSAGLPSAVSKIVVERISPAKFATVLGVVWAAPPLLSYLLRLFVDSKLWTSILRLPVAGLGALLGMGFWLWFRNQQEELKTKDVSGNHPAKVGVSKEFSEYRRLPSWNLLGSANVWALCAMFSLRSVGNHEFVFLRGNVVGNVGSHYEVFEIWARLLPLACEIHPFQGL